MAALLSLHYKISLAAKKEVHFFDKSEVFKKGLSFYLRSFHSFNVSTDSRGILSSPLVLNTHKLLIVHIDLKLSVDATPSYISSRVSCQRINSSLPYVKLLVLLRNPISRAYSEYQMKARRVHDQQMFLKLILENQKHFRRCFDDLAAQQHVSGRLRMSYSEILYDDPLPCNSARFEVFPGIFERMLSKKRHCTFSVAEVNGSSEKRQ